MYQRIWSKCYQVEEEVIADHDRSPEINNNMSSRMSAESSSASLAQFASVLRPNPTRDDIPLMRAATSLLHSNDHEVLGVRLIGVRSGALPVSFQTENISGSVGHLDPQAGPSTSHDASQSLEQTDVDSGNSRPDADQEARRAKEVLGMATHTSENITLTPEWKAQFIASLPTATVDTAIYNPFGTFILPCRDLQIDGETTLRSLITSIQELVDLQVKSQGVQGPLLVSSIQVRLFIGEDYTGFPKIRGELKGAQHKYPDNESISNPSSSGSHHAAASAYSRGELEDKDIPSADCVHWIVGPGSEVELYWEQWRIAIQLDARRRLLPGSSSAYPRGHENKRPVLKVMTVKRTGGLLGLFVGVHTFGLQEFLQDTKESSERQETAERQAIPEGQDNPKSQETPEEQEAPTTPKMGKTEASYRGKGKGKAKAPLNPNDEMIAAAQEAAKKRYDPRIANDIRDSEIDFALRFARSLNERDTEQKSPATTTKLILAQMKEEGQEPLPVLVQKEASPQAKKEHRWIPNWGTYQKMGGDPKMHKLIPLGNVPFEPTNLGFQGPEEGQETGDTPLAYDIFRPGQIRPTDFVVYQHMDADLVEVLMESQTTVSNSYHREKKDRAAGFDEVDDNIFLYGTLSPAKPAASIISPQAQVPGSTEPFPNFEAQRQHEESPLHHYSTAMHHALNLGRQDSPHHQSSAYQMRGLGSDLGNLGDLMSKSTNNSNNPLDTLSQSYNTPFYDYHGNPINTNNPGHYNRGQSSQVTDGNMARNAPPGLQQPWAPMRTPSPTKNQYPNQGGANSLANMRNIQSFAAFNNFAHESHAHQYQNQNQGFYNQQHSSTTGTQPLGHGHAQGYYVSPTKTHEQMSRAFNSATTFSSTANTYNSGTQFSSGGMQNFAGTYGNASQTGTTPTPSFNQLNAAAYSYQPQGQVQPQSQNQGMSSQIPPTPGSSQVQGSATYYSAVPNPNMNAPGVSTNVFNVGAGTSRGWMAGGGVSSPRTARPTGGLPRRLVPGVGNSQLRADSPAFTSVIGGTAGRGRAASGAGTTAGFLRGVHVLGADGDMVQVNLEAPGASAGTGVGAEAGGASEEDAGGKGKAEGEHYMGVDPS